MAMCPRCNQKGRIEIDNTGGTLTFASRPGTFSLAGVTPKVSAFRVAQMRMTCACGWSITGYIQNAYMIEYPSGQTPETRA